MILQLFLTFFKIGLFTFGGGYAMIANIKEEVVEKKQWLSDDELMQIIGIAESTPGPIAINLATYVGYKKRRFCGSLFSTLGIILPSLIIIYIISLFLDSLMINHIVAYAFKGIKCAVAFLILRAGFGIFKKIPKTPLSYIVFATVLFLMITFEILSVNFSSIFFIIAGGLLGIVLYKGGNKK